MNVNVSDLLSEIYMSVYRTVHKPALSYRVHSTVHFQTDVFYNELYPGHITKIIKEIMTK
jgi:hypothetical protein